MTTTNKTTRVWISNVDHANGTLVISKETDHKKFFHPEIIEEYGCTKENWKSVVKNIFENDMQNIEESFIEFGKNKGSIKYATIEKTLDDFNPFFLPVCPDRIIENK